MRIAQELSSLSSSLPLDLASAIFVRTVCIQKVAQLSSSYQNPHLNPNFFLKFQDDSKCMIMKALIIGYV